MQSEDNFDEFGMDEGISSGRTSESLLDDEAISPLFSPVSRSATPLGHLRPITPTASEVPLEIFPATACAVVGTYKGELKTFPAEFAGLSDARQREFLSHLNVAFSNKAMQRDRATPDICFSKKKPNGVKELETHVQAAQECRVTFLDLMFYAEGSYGRRGPFVPGEYSKLDSIQAMQRSLEDQFYIASFAAGTAASTTKFANSTGLKKSIRRIKIPDPSRQKYSDEMRHNVLARNILVFPSLADDCGDDCICDGDLASERNRRAVCSHHGSFPSPESVIADNVFNKNINDRMCMPGCFRIPLIDREGKRGYIIVVSITEAKTHDTRLISVICGPPVYSATNEKISDGGLIPYEDEMESFPAIVRTALKTVAKNPDHAGDAFRATKTLPGKYAPHIHRKRINNGRDGDVFEEVAGAVLSVTTPDDVRDAFRVSILSMSAHLRSYSPESDTDIARYFSTYFILSALSGVHNNSCHLNSSWSDEEHARMAFQLIGRGSAWEALTNRLAMTTRFAQEQILITDYATGTRDFYKKTLSIDSRDKNYATLMSAAAERAFPANATPKALGSSHADDAIRLAAVGAWRDEQVLISNNNAAAASRTITKRMVDDGHSRNVEEIKRQRKLDNVQTRSGVVQ